MFINDFPLWPEAASSNASQVDALYIFLIVVCGAMALIVFTLLIFFAVKYRRRPGNEIGQNYEPPRVVEVSLIIIWFGAFMAMFAFGAKVYFDENRPPDNAMEIYGVGKQWMWKFQHPEGQSEINELHLPIGRPVKMILSSEDVIHSFFVPAFRIKKDALPSRYTVTWFTPTKVGRYHLFCAEYCGTDHSGMIGWVDVMEPTEYQNWAAGGGPEGAPAAEGKKLFDKFACSTCHTNDSTGRGPILAGLLGSTVTFTTGAQLQADDDYIRESIENPTAKIVEGYQPIMPTFKGQMNEAQMMQLISYVKSMTVATPASPQPAATGAATSISGSQQQKLPNKAK